MTMETIIDIFATAARLEHVRSRPPRPLPHLAARQRDGPKGHPESLARERSHHGHPGASQHGKRPIDYRSKGIG
jgi:hypothetical protein